MSAADRLNEIEDRANAADRAGVFESDHPTWAAWEAAWDSSTDVPALVAAHRAVLDVIDRRGKQAAEVLPPSLAARAVPSHQFNVRASDVIRAIEEALS